MKYVLIAALAAVAAFLLAPLLLHQPAAPPPRTGALDARFPLQTGAFQQPAAEDLRWHEKRGHAFSLKDRDESDPSEDPRWQRILAGRPKIRPFPGGCLDCHASNAAAQTPYWQARARLDKPIGCPDCHDPQTAVLRLTRPGLVPASTQEMRTLICAQCHREYYLAPGLQFPKGRTVDEIEAFYAGIAFRDWDHAETGAAVLLPQHPQFELHSQGIHAASGVACADCHMPYQRHGALRITVHNARSPLLDIDRSCLPCHRSTPEEMKDRVRVIQQRTEALLARAEDALVALLDDLHSAGTAPAAVLAFQTKAQWRVTFVAADKSKGFHAPQESARILAEAIDYARQGQLALARTRIP
jgi:nitrite reductase (cytochrome c-552)